MSAWHVASECKNIVILRKLYDLAKQNLKTEKKSYFLTPDLIGKPCSTIQYSEAT